MSRCRCAPSSRCGRCDVKSCAICANPIKGTPHLEPIGRNDALVFVCSSCATEPAREIQGPTLAYEPGEGMGYMEMRGRIASYRNSQSKAVFFRSAPLMPRERTPGWLIVRVPIRDASGVTRDSQTIEQILRSKPFASELRRLGTTNTHHLFEYPDPKVAAESRGRSENPLVFLEQYREAR